jgi:excisionase family DNA binding protein
MSEIKTERPFYYTLSEVATQLKVSERTVRRWIHGGKLEARRFGRQLRISPKALEQLSDSGEVSESASWSMLSGSTFAEDWDNALDSDYDDWERHYGLSKG